MKELLVPTVILAGGFVIMATLPNRWIGWCATAMVILTVLYLTYEKPPSSPAT